LGIFWTLFIRQHDAYNQLLVFAFHNMVCLDIVLHLPLLLLRGKLFISNYRTSFLPHSRETWWSKWIETCEYLMLYLKFNNNLLGQYQQVNPKRFLIDLFVHLLAEEFYWDVSIRMFALLGLHFLFFWMANVSMLRGSLGAAIKLLSCDWKVTGSSPGNNLLCNKHGKAVYSTIHQIVGPLFRPCVCGSFSAPAAFF